MRYFALVTDYDGTLAEHGRVDEPTLDALQRVRRSGRKLVLVTGRQLPDLLEIFPQFAIFDRIVAENGAVLFRPDAREEKVLAEPPDARLVALLSERGVQPLGVGHAIVSTWQPQESAVLAAIHELGLELQMIFNKGAVMVLPTGVNKASGMQAALAELHLSAHKIRGSRARTGTCSSPAPRGDPVGRFAQGGLITVHPDHVAPVVPMVTAIVAVGADPGQTLATFGAALGQPQPAIPAPAGEAAALAWWREAREARWFRPVSPQAEHQRHVRKYMEGELGPDKSFYFRGPEEKLNLRAHNLTMFLQLADGVDDETWLHHLRRGDYSLWFREAIKDPSLAAETEPLESDAGLSATESRARIRALVRERYTAPA